MKSLYIVFKTKIICVKEINLSSDSPVTSKFTHIQYACVQALELKKNAFCSHEEALDFLK
ncbi:hypothetical protein B7P43_G16412 [Cryptotermes secundus]|uniref:Uncharacterized protein n=1 Tax=Cryptotermes secundus TaxID=105785 RepID=A0A2J7PV41_9NEOP|nr:hypothetical protein B7P43_G16412 [Cryptotermes secundus]